MNAPATLFAENSLERLLERVWPRLKAQFARRQIPPQDTEDILQQALLALVYQHDSIRDPEAWLLGTVRNKCLLYWRDQRRKLYQPVDAALLEGFAEPQGPDQEEGDIRRDLETALERLPRRCRQLLLLRFCHGYDPLEVARRLGYSPASISKVTTRCLAALTRELAAAGVARKKGNA